MNVNQEHFKLHSVAELEEATIVITKLLELGKVDKPLLGRIFKGIFELTELLDRKEPGIFTAVVEWFRLYLKMLISIDPKNTKLLQQFEKSIPTAISYIIGCLQYKARDAPGFHYNLLDIMDNLLQNSQPNVIKQFANFESGTISCIWKPIDFVGDFNTQLLALQIFARCLKSLDVDKQRRELKAIKWTNLKLFKDNLNQVIEKTQHKYAFESACRDLLNSFNMNLSNKLLVYSFYCNTLVIANKYEFFKPLYFDKFWVDINYCPHTISFKGRHKLSATSLKFEYFNVVLKWKKIKLVNNCLLFTIDSWNSSNLPNTIICDLTDYDQLKIDLPYEEEQRIKDNDHFVGYLNSIADIDDCIAECNTSPQVPKPFVSGPINSLPSTPLTSKNKENSDKKQQYSLRQNTTKRKFFKYLESDEEGKPKKQPKKEPKKKCAAVKKPRILKPRNNRKSVCKVVPLVDLTKSPEIKKTAHSSDTCDDGVTNDPPGPLHVVNGKSTVPDIQLNERQCAAILDQVKSVCYMGAIYDNLQIDSGAEPCQSYRNYKTRPTNRRFGSKDKETDALMKSPIEVVSKEHNMGPSRKEVRPEQYNNVTPEKAKSRINKRKIASQHLFDNLESEENLSPTRKRATFAEDIQNKSKTAATVDHNKVKDSPDVLFISSDGGYKKNASTLVLSQHSIPKTPTSTTTMNVSDIYDTPTATNHFLLKGTRTDGKMIYDTPFGSQKLNKNEEVKNVMYTQKEKSTKNNNYGKPNETVRKIIHDWQDSDVDEDGADTGLQQNMQYDQPNMGKCVVYRKRLESDNSDSDCDSVVDAQAQLICPTTSKHVTSHPSYSDICDKDVRANVPDQIFCNATLPKISLNIPDLPTSKYISPCTTLLPKALPGETILQYRDATKVNSLETLVGIETTSPMYKYNVETKANSLNTLDGIESTNLAYENKTKRIVKNVTHGHKTKTTECQVTPSVIIMRQVQVNSRETVLIANSRADNFNKSLNTGKGLFHLFNNKEQKNGFQRPNNDQEGRQEEADSSKSLLKLYNNENLNKCIQGISCDHNLKLNIVPLNNNKRLCQQSDLTYRDGPFIPVMFGVTEILKTNEEKLNFENIFETLTVSSKTYGSATMNITKSIDCKKSLLRKQKTNDSFLSKIVVTNNSNLLTLDCVAAPKLNTTIETLSLTNDINNSDKYTTEVNDFLNKNEMKYHQEMILDTEVLRTKYRNQPNQDNSDIVEDADLSELINGYNAKIQNAMNNVRLLSLSNSFDSIKQKVCDITECVINESKELRKEIENLQLSMERLTRQMEWLYQSYVKRSREYESFQETVLLTLEAVENLNMQTGITAKHTDIIKQFTTLEKNIRQEAWHNYLLKQKKALLNEIDTLEEI